MSAARRTCRRALAALALTGALTGTALAPVASAEAGGPTPSAEYAGDPVREAELVASEDARVSGLRTVVAQVRRDVGEGEASPLVVPGTGLPTVVLPPREQAYTLGDLREGVPQLLLAQPDGSVLLAAHLLVPPGAGLELVVPGGTLRLLSGPGADGAPGFASIVSLGGRVALAGGPGQPLAVESWDGDGPDTDTSDGRAYVRAEGGQFTLRHAMVSDLGFWSGRTGGVALAGTGTGPSLATEGSPEPAAEGSVIEDVVLGGNAFGLFATDTTGLVVRGTTVDGSLVDGIVLHRAVTAATVEDTVSRDNAGDGFVLSRTVGTTLRATAASGNGGNGYTVDGQPLADGPSAAGASTASYGENSLVEASARDNGRYGVDVVGGSAVTVRRATVTGGDMGVVVRDGASAVVLDDSRITGTRRHGIAVRDGARGVVVSGNRVDRAATGVYLRDSTATVRDNTVTGAARHGLTLVGSTSGSFLWGNRLSGTGPSPVDADRSTSLVVDVDVSNDVSAWDPERSLRSYLTPLTLLWATIFAVVALSAVQSRRHQRGVGGDPYAHKHLDGMSAGPSRDGDDAPGAPAPVVDLREPAAVAHR